MKFILAAQLFWPVWLGMSEVGHTYYGMLAGTLVVVGTWSWMWHREFGTWKFWGA